MSKVINIDCSRRRKALVFGSFLSLIAMILLPNPAAAQCSKWDMSGKVLIFQKNLRLPVELTLEQKGRVISGRSYQQIDSGNFGVITNRGLVDGTVDGDRVSFQIFWPGQVTGIYNATVLPSGRLDGEGYEKSTPGIKVTFFSGGTLKCLPPPPPPVIPKPIKSSGKAKVKPAPAPTSQSAPPPMKVPGIIAGFVYFPNAYAPTTSAAIRWDGGPDHPYAEVWVKINGGEPTFLVEQGKGQRQITVDRGKVYTYILTDAGKTLASVTVVGQ